MSTQTVNIIFYSITILASITQMCISVYVLLLMIIYRQIIREHRVDYLLCANTYIVALFSIFFVIDMCAYSIYGQRYMEISFDGWWCKIKGYCLYISGSTFFYTFALQAFYRFCRIVYPEKVGLQSFRLYIILSIGLWILSSFILLPSLLVGDIEYMINHYHCQFSPKSLRGSLTIYSVGFILPFGVTVYCYTWTMYRVRRQTAALLTINQRIGMQRDMIILKRVMTFLCVITIVAAPHILLPIVYIIVGDLPEWIVSFEWAATESAAIGVSITLLWIFPHMKKLWTRFNAIDFIRPVTMTRD